MFTSFLIPGNMTKKARYRVPKTMHRVMVETSPITGVRLLWVYYSEGREEKNLILHIFAIK